MHFVYIWYYSSKLKDSSKYHQQKTLCNFLWDLSVTLDKGV